MSGDVPEDLTGYEEETHLARDLSLSTVTIIGVGVMVGTSIFVLPGLAAGVSGPAMIMAFAFNGFITIFTGMVYAELGSAIPEAGGGYLWVRDALGRSQAFLAGWMSWFAHAVAGSYYALGFGTFLALLLGEYFHVSLFGLPSGTLRKAFAVFAGIAFTYINYRGAKETGTVANIVTLVQLTVVVTLIAVGIGIVFGRPDTAEKFTPFLPRGFGSVFVTMAFTFIAFEGYEIIVQSGEEIIEPKKNIPKAIFYSMLVVVTIYMLLGAVMLGAVDLSPALLRTARADGANLPANPALWQVLGHLGELGFARAMDQVIPYGTPIVLVAGIFSSLAALNGTTYSSARVGFAMGRDQVLPDALSSVHAENKTPYLSVFFSGALIVSMAVALPIEDVIAATDVMFLLLFLQVNYAAIKIRNEWGDEIDYGYVMPWFPYVPIVGILTKLFLAVFVYQYSAVAWYGAIVWIVAGLGIFFVYSHRRIRATEAERATRTVTGEYDPAERPYQVLVPIANPEHAERLVRVGGAIARRKNGELLLTSVATVPAQTPLSEGKRHVEDERELLAAAIAHVPEDVPAHRVVTVGHEVGRSIRNVAIQHESDLIVLGWRGRRKRVPDYVLGSIIDHVVEHAPCDVAVVKTDGPNGLRDVLVPTAGGPHAEVAEEFAAAFAREGARVTLLTVATDDPSASEALLEKRRERCEEDGIEVSTAVVEADDVTEAILEFARNNDTDTIVIGAAGEGILRRVVFGEIPEAVGERFDGQVIMVKKHRPVRSAVRRYVRKWVGKGTQASSE